MQKKKGFTILFLRVLTILCCLVVGSCSVSKTKYQKQYSLVWKEIVKSEAWRNSIVKENAIASKEEDFYTSNADVVLEDSENLSFLKSEVAFKEKYHDLVSKAYRRIIAQAESADTRLKTEYNQWNKNGQISTIKKDKDSRQKQALVTKKYRAHQAMLEGLKSWNIFSEDRSADLDFFKAENENEVFSTLTLGESEERVINLLVYKLADLYHFEDQ